MDKEKLYETFGELLYTLAKADGLIQKEEVETLNSLLKSHPWASTVKWSFDYEVKKNHSIEDIYKKVIDSCHQFGPTEEYKEFIDVMENVARASGGIDDHERTIIESFSKDLTKRFKKDLENLM